MHLMNPEQAHAILSSAASRALLNEADRFAVIQARDTLGVFVKEHLPKDGPPQFDSVKINGARTADLDPQLSKRTSTAPRK